MSNSRLDDRNDSTLISMALKFWANFIETHDPALSAKDAKGKWDEMIRPLNSDQKSIVVYLRKLAHTCLTNDVKFVRRDGVTTYNIKLTESDSGDT